MFIKQVVLAGVQHHFKEKIKLNIVEKTPPQ